LKIPAWARVTIYRTGGGEAGNGEPGEDEVDAVPSIVEGAAELEVEEPALITEAREPRDETGRTSGVAGGLDTELGSPAEDDGGRPHAACTGTKCRAGSLSGAAATGRAADERAAKGKTSSTK
jgi:hypothetical protein